MMEAARLVRGKEHGHRWQATPFKAVACTNPKIIVPWCCVGGAYVFELDKGDVQGCLELELLTSAEGSGYNVEP